MIRLNAFSTSPSSEWISLSTWLCFQNLVNRHLQQQVLDIYSDNITDLTSILKITNKPVYYSSISKGEEILQWRPDAIDTVLILKQSLPSLLIKGPRGRTVFITANLSIATNLWVTHGLLDTIVLVPEQSNETVAYTWFPFDRKQCGKKARLKKLDTCTATTNWTVNLYPQKLPAYFKGCSLNFLTYPINPDITNENKTLGGRDVELVTTVANYLGFHLIWEQNFSIFFTEFNGKPVGGLGKVHNGDTDFIIGNIPADEAFPWCEPLPSHRTLLTVWMLPTAKLASRISGIYRGLPIKIWILVLAAHVAATLVVWFIATVDRINWSWLDILSLTIASPMPTISESRLIRIFLITFQFYALHIAWFYQSTLLRTLFIEPMDKQLTTIEEALDAGLKPMYNRYFRDDVIESMGEENLNRNGFVEAFPMNYSLLVEMKSVFMFSFESPDKVILHAMYPNNSMSQLVYIDRKIVEENRISIYGRRGSPLTKLWHTKILHILESGIYSHFTEMSHFFQEKPITNSKANRALDLETLEAAFIILAFFTFVCTILFLFEIIYYKCKSKKEIVSNSSKPIRRMGMVANAATKVLMNEYSINARVETLFIDSYLNETTNKKCKQIIK